MGWVDGKSPYVAPTTTAPTTTAPTTTATPAVTPQTVNTLAKGNMEKPVNPDAISDPATVTQTDPNTTVVAKGTTTVPVSPSNPPSDKDWNNFLDQHYATIKSAGLGDKINDIRTGKPASGATSLPADTGVAKANTPVGSMPAAKSSIPADSQGTKNFTGMPTQSAPAAPAPRIKVPMTPPDAVATKANIPSVSAPATNSYTVNKGDNLSKILQGMGQTPTPAAIKAFAAANNIKNPNLIKPGQVLNMPSIKEIMIKEYQDFKNKA